MLKQPRTNLTKGRQNKREKLGDEGGDGARRAYTAHSGDTAAASRSRCALEEGGVTLRISLNIYAIMQLRMAAQLQATVNTAIELRHEGEEDALKTENGDAKSGETQARKMVKLDDAVKTIEPPVGKKTRIKPFGQVFIYCLLWVLLRNVYTGTKFAISLLRVEHIPSLLRVDNEMATVRLLHHCRHHRQLCCDGHGSSLLEQRHESFQPEAGTVLRHV